MIMRRFKSYGFAVAMTTLLAAPVASRNANADDAIVTINIVGAGGRAKYIAEGETEQKQVTVAVGQTVRWSNGPQSAAHTATATMKDADGRVIFDTGTIRRNEQADVLLDRELYERAGGKVGGSVVLEYFCVIHGIENMKSSILLADAPDLTPPGGPARPLAALRIRQDIAKLTDTQLSSLRRGIAVMRSRPLSDPTSWSYWANIHALPGAVTDPLWFQCRHGDLHFFTWHRAYLYYFEQVLRKASGDPALTLPYWNWSVNRSLPPAFRVATLPDGTANSLFESRRRFNDGSSLPLRLIVVELQNLLYG